MSATDVSEPTPLSPDPRDGAGFTVGARPGSGREALLDEEIHSDVIDLLTHDARIAHLGLAVDVRGAVVHVRGRARTDAERDLVRRLVRRVSGVRAAWDLLSVEDGPELRVADVGCGGQKQVPEAIGVDVAALPGVDVVADVQQGLPFADRSLDHVFAVHVLEHLTDLLGVMRELHRVLRPTGLLHVLAPHWRHVNAVADPTHCRMIDAQTFKYFVAPRPGVLPWRVLIAGQSEDTVYADLQPIDPDGPPSGPGEIARWFG